MTGQMDDQPHPSWQISGNATAIEGEIRRLDDLKERLWVTGDTLRRLSVEDWAGAASNAFEESRDRLARQWLAVGDSHVQAARALEQYHVTLLELRRRLAAVDLKRATPAVAADIARWNEQLESAAHTAAMAIRDAARGLANLPRVFTPDISPPVPAAPTSTVAPVPRDQLDPRSATADRSLFHRRVRELSNEVLAANYIAISLA
jgi:hypothetical protein